MPTVYVTVPRESAAELASALVEERLAACVNRVDCRSTYRWEGEVRAEEEAVLFLKTTDERYPDLRERVLELHPHEVPCIERFDEAEVYDPYAEWMRESVR
jgi:periplasmic divalent cation tolerance protein